MMRRAGKAPKETRLSVMSQILSQSLGQHLRMEQRLTPQLIQSMAILQKPVSELEAHVAEALETNAALEIDEDLGDSDRSAERNNRERKDEHGDSSGFARLERFSRDYSEFANNWSDGGPRTFRQSGGSDERDPKLAAMANTAGRSESLQEHLLAQWSLFDLDEQASRAGELIINHLDQDGYLRVRLDELAVRSRSALTVETLERALEEIHKLDPPGIGARDVIECLLLQLDALPGDNTIERTLIERHLDDIIHNRLPAIAKTTGYAIGEITEALKAMRRSLCLHPGFLVVDRDIPPVRPDVIVEYSDDGGLDMRLSRGNMPRLKISNELAALARGRDKNGKETRDFARKQIEEAGALIDAVHFRQSRLTQVSKAIIEKQREFFDIGPQGLKVLRMSDLAEELNCDPSTISRTVADKHIQTPRGIYPLRYFFTGGTETNEGESVGWDRVKDRVREVIGAEDKVNPLNDDQVADILKKEGIEISRRTVAKYRAQLDIPSARQRRTF